MDVKIGIGIKIRDSHNTPLILFLIGEHHMSSLSTYPTLWYNPSMDILFMLYPDGRIEGLGNHSVRWFKCWFTDSLAGFANSNMIEFVGAI